MIRLHGWWSTNPQKVRLALEELALDYEYQEVDLAKKQNRTPEYAALHPRQRIPALEIDDLVLWESGAALMYLSQRQQRLWPRIDSERAQAMNLLFFESAAFQEVAGIHFFNRCILPSIGKEGDESRLAKAQKKIAPHLDILAEQLCDRDYLFGELTVVDLAFAPWVPWIDLDAHPGLVAWRERLRARSSWHACGIREPD